MKNEVNCYKNTEEHILKFKEFYSRRIKEARRKASKEGKSTEAFSLRLDDGISFSYCN